MVDSTYLNGQVASANDSVNGNWSSFTYDDFGRLKGSWCSANCPDGTNAEGYNYTYDEYGNRWWQTLASGSGPGPQPEYSFDAYNHLTPTNCTSGPGNFCYDAAGNLEYDGLGGNWAHDAEGRVFEYEGSSETATYTHDAAGQRVERTVSGATYDYVFDNQGKENTQGTAGFAGWNWSELYLGGMHVNTYADGSTYFSHADHLGSERTETDPTGNTNSSAQTNLPFGEWTSTGFQSGLGFTGDSHDDGGVFHTPNRQLSQTQGRWMIPDPAGLAAVNPWNPQTWNRYAYVTNNPVTFNDPSGLASPMLRAIMGGGGFVGTFAQMGWNAISSAASSLVSGLMNSGGATPTCSTCDPGTPGGVSYIGQGNPGSNDSPIWVPGGCVSDGVDKSCVNPSWMTQQELQASGVFVAGASNFPPGMNGQQNAAADAARNFGKNLNPNNNTPTEEPWPSNKPLDWETDFMYPETRALKALMDSFADGLDETLGRSGVFMVSPNIMGCACYGNLPCDDGSPTSF